MAANHVLYIYYEVGSAELLIKTAIPHRTSLSFLHGNNGRNWRSTCAPVQSLLCSVTADGTGVPGRHLICVRSNCEYSMFRASMCIERTIE